MTLNSSKEADDLFDKNDYKKIMIANGKLYKTNIDTSSKDAKTKN